MVSHVANEVTQNDNKSDKKMHGNKTSYISCYMTHKGQR